MMRLRVETDGLNDALQVIQVLIEHRIFFDVDRYDVED